jgi:hypothetical protein
MPGIDLATARIPLLTEEEKHAAEVRVAMDTARRAGAGLARYKIELFFAHTRSAHGASAGAVSLWESGAELHGGGDAKIYLCPGRSLRLSDCEALIPDRANAYGFLACPSCKNVWRADQVHGEILAKLAPPAWAELLVRMFQKLGCTADVVLKYPREDLRAASTKEQARQRMGEHLARARAARVAVIYPLARILADTQNGGDLYARFLAFLRA